MMRIASVLMACLLACSVAGASRALAAVRGGMLTFARSVDCQYLDPVHTTQNADIWISLNIYATLLEPTADGKDVQAGLAASHSVSADGKTVTLKLRPGLKFADGSPLLASDAAWSLNRAAKKETGGDFAFLLSAVDRVSAPSDDTVVVSLSRPDPTILQALATFNAGIMPEKLVMAAAGATLEDKSKAFAEKPIGSGPFFLQSWKRNTEMVLTRNPHFYKAGEDGKPLPYLDAIKFLIIPDDATRILKLKAGEIDIAEFVPYSRVGELKADPKLQMILYPAAQMNYFALNSRPTLKDGSKNPLNDVRVRQALNYATNKQAIIQVVTYGAGTPARSFMPMSTPMSYGPGPLYPYDMAKAKQLLADAGYPQGFEITCLVLAGSADDTAKTTALQQMWAPLGVKLKVEQLESATRLARYNNADFQMRTSLWTNDINDPGQVTSIFAYFPSRQNNRGGWQDARNDALFEASRSELDAAKRAAMFKEIQERYAEAAPIVFAMEVPYPVAMLKKVHGFVQIPLGNNIFTETYLDK